MMLKIGVRPCLLSLFLGAGKVLHLNEYKNIWRHACKIQNQSDVLTWCQSPHQLLSQLAKMKFSCLTSKLSVLHQNEEEKKNNWRKSFVFVFYFRELQTKTNVQNWSDREREEGKMRVFDSGKGTKTGGDWRGGTAQSTEESEAVRSTWPFSSLVQLDGD